MKRDRTVPISLILGAGGIIAYVFWDVPERITPEDPWILWIPLCMIIIACLRASILWLQTFFDAVSPSDQQTARVGWVLAHLTFSIFASYIYYFTMKKGRKIFSAKESDREIKRRANEETLLSQAEQATSSNGEKPSN